MSIVMGHISQIMTRNLSMDILRTFSWGAYISLSQESIGQLSFWKAHLGKLNIKDIFESYKCSKIVYSDASTTGFAGYEINTVNGISHWVWTSEERAKSSTWREMMAVCRCLGSLSNVLAYQRVKWFSDNKGITSIVRKGSMKKELQDIALEIILFVTLNQFI